VGTDGRGGGSPAGTGAVGDDDAGGGGGDNGGGCGGGQGAIIPDRYATRPPLLSIFNGGREKNERSCILLNCTTDCNVEHVF
jgi:hypothetical protein